MPTFSRFAAPFRESPLLCSFLPIPQWKLETGKGPKGSKGSFYLSPLRQRSHARARARGGGGGEGRRLSCRIAEIDFEKSLWVDVGGIRQEEEEEGGGEVGGLFVTLLNFCIAMKSTL